MSSRENRDQIPNKSNEEQTREAMRRQENNPGESREKSVSNFPKAAALAQALKEMNFPTDKTGLVRFLQESANQETREILPVVQRIENRRYSSVSEVAEAAELVR